MPVYIAKCHNGCKIVGKGRYRIWKSVVKAQLNHEELTGHMCEVIDLNPSGTERMTPQQTQKKISQRDLIQALIIEKGPQTLDQLYDKLDIPEGSIRRVLSTWKGELFQTFGPFWRVLPSLSELSTKPDQPQKTEGNLKIECDYLGIGGLVEEKHTEPEIQMVSEQIPTNNTEEEGQTLG